MQCHAKTVFLFNLVYLLSILLLSMGYLHVHKNAFTSLNLLPLPGTYIIILKRNIIKGCKYLTSSLSFLWRTNTLIFYCTFIIVKQDVYREYSLSIKIYQYDLVTPIISLNVFLPKENWNNEQVSYLNGAGNESEVLVIQGFFAICTII